MALPKIDPTQTKAWQALGEHYHQIKDIHLKSLFAEDADRATKLSLQWQDFYVDYSKNRITPKTKELLLQLAKEVELKAAIDAYFGGEIINETEGRAVLHTALRAKKDVVAKVDGENVIPEVYQVKEQIKAFSEAVISGEKKGYTGKTFNTVVNIGIGGSDLGPVMVTEALKFYKNHLKTYFVSNVDGDHVNEVLKEIDPETTLFIIVSKSFTTQETLSNAETIKAWFLKHGTQTDVALHFAAVSTNTKMIDAFGIADENVFPMWDWVGGRFSLWSAVGLSIALALGYEHFEALLDGAQEMDSHFKEAPLDENLPTILGLLTVWYNNFFGADTEAVIPYTQYLHRFPAYLQQGIMESNGKSVARNGELIPYQTGNIVWGEPGTNSQHAFFQLIHQGTKLIPADFIGYKKSLYGNTDHHNKLMANFFAQTEALMNGKTLEEVTAELQSQGLQQKDLDKLAQFKVFDGNKPTTTLLIDQLTPKSLGALIALYEHRIFVQGVVWNIFSYDQWGVELGKQLAKTILKDIENPHIANHDSSTLSLLQKFKD
ncbi:glucose-6-phosphate isomerase [Flavobacterium sp. ASW18X]|uniref:glucose-6-phosphate isomerase n=1 Tax=Flavobacterium sp. ASW18X TaxID=2572595 RepID=UPI0010ADD522|nr:glucose-6-phosphate isomerase [Flavobacterium sp. ASW18X]TKD65278.1 glucose-6-phosphate isomerase [Flavobacterium sp. ASW18X]